ncbi:hypothetical protein D3C87_1060630 [compost metagenome]
MDHLRRVTQQRLGNLAFEHAGEEAGEGVFQHQPDPAEQHDHGDPTRQALLTIDHDETADPGDEPAKRNDPGIALHQFENALDQELYFWHLGGSRLEGKKPRQSSAGKADGHLKPTHFIVGVSLLAIAEYQPKKW